MRPFYVYTSLEEAGIRKIESEQVENVNRVGKTRFLECCLKARFRVCTICVSKKLELSLEIGNTPMKDKKPAIRKYVQYISSSLSAESECFSNIKV